MLSIDKLQSRLAQVEARLAHDGGLLAKMGGSAEGWEYNGKCTDAGKPTAFCACGHPIRFIFHIEHATKGMLNIGSTCIESVLTLSPELGNALQAADLRLQEQIKEAKRQIKAAADDQTVQGLREQFITLRNRACDEYDRRIGGQSRVYLLWTYTRTRKYGIPENPPEYRRACDMIRWYKDKIKIFSDILGDNEQERITNGGK